MTILVLITQSSFADTTYCTRDNWTKTINNVTKYEDKLQDRIDRYNELFTTQKNMDFYSDSATKSNLLVAILRHDTAFNEKSTDFMSAEKDLMNTELKSIDSEINKLKSLNRRFSTATKSWSTIAESCYDDDEYSNYKRARGLMRTSISQKEYIGKLINKLDRIKQKYDAEIQFLDATKKAYQPQSAKTINKTIAEKADEEPCTCVFNQNRQWNPENVMWNGKYWECSIYNSDGTCGEVQVLERTVPE